MTATDTTMAIPTVGGGKPDPLDMRNYGLEKLKEIN